MLLSSKRSPHIVLIPIKGRSPFNIDRVLRPRGKPHIDPGICKGCGFCIEFCPLGVLEFSDTVNSWGYQYPRIKPGMEDACVGCGMCERVCPEFAIEVLEEHPAPYRVSWGWARGSHY